MKNKKETPGEDDHFFDKYVKKWASRKFLGVIAASFYFSIGLLGGNNWTTILVMWMFTEKAGNVLIEYLKNRK